MYVPNAQSEAFQRIAFLIESNIDKLKEYGVSPAGSSHPRERLLSAGRGFTLKLRLETVSSTISVSIHNDNRRGFPKRCRFQISGTADTPQIAEQSVDDCFWNLIEQFRSCALGVTEPIPCK